MVHALILICLLTLGSWTTAESVSSAADQNLLLVLSDAENNLDTEDPHFILNSPSPSRYLLVNHLTRDFQRIFSTLELIAAYKSRAPPFVF